MSKFALLAAILAAGSLWTLARAQDRTKLPTYRASTGMVLVPVTVTDRHGKTIRGLRAEDFEVFDERLPQPVVSVSGVELPTSIVLVLDISGSMRGTLSAFKDVVNAFLSGSNPEDEFSLLSVSSKPASISGFTSDLEFIRDTVQLAGAGGGTALIDAIHLGLNEVRLARRSRTAMLILSDGMDNSSRYSRRELMREAMETNAQIYSMIIDDGPATRKAGEMAEAQAGWQLLEGLAEMTGGLHFRVRGAAAARDAAAKAGAAMRSAYVIGYRAPEMDGSGKWRRVKIKTEIPGAHVSARGGYFGQ